MAHSREYTYWHLTPSGWVAGDSKTDFGQKTDRPEPADTLKTVIYSEELSSPFSRLVKGEQIIFEHPDKVLVAKAEKDFPAKFYIN